MRRRQASTLIEQVLQGRAPSDVLSDATTAQETFIFQTGDKVRTPDGIGRVVMILSPGMHCGGFPGLDDVLVEFGGGATKPYCSSDVQRVQ
jgi:hypothetical protein